MTETVDHPAHYNQLPSGVECIDVVEHLSFNVGNAIKYLWRAGLKSEDAVEDLRKAGWYVQREIERLGKAGTGEYRDADGDAVDWRVTPDRLIVYRRPDGIWPPFPINNTKPVWFVGSFDGPPPPATASGHWVPDESHLP